MRVDQKMLDEGVDKYERARFRVECGLNVLPVREQIWLLAHELSRRLKVMSNNRRMSELERFSKMLTANMKQP